MRKENEKELSGKVALVTGGSRGIGAGIALALGGAGAKVIVNYFEHKEQAEQVVRQITESGGEAVSFGADVSEGEQVESILSFVASHYGGVDILINNAGIHQHLTIDKLTFEDWDRVVNVDLDSAFLLTKGVLPYMKKRGWGRIVNMSSLSGFAGTKVECHYAATKAGLIGFTKAVALEVASFGITVNAISPGSVETDMLDIKTEEDRKRRVAPIPVGRIGQPEDIAHATLFLVSPKASFITGETIHVNGGQGLY
ncbi:MAG: 3-oxoacyl-ACP reductase FabG [Gemmatimonadota bacterium]|nr:MAG: 3-oxoacyl-ACP reductase FabG [Gemmatimonadota bacterium]